MERYAIIDVIAGVNGAGKSSLLGEKILDSNGAFYNPDIVAKAIKQDKTEMPQSEANGLAWEYNFAFLSKALVDKHNYSFETTLGGRSITDLLVHHILYERARINLSFVGLNSVDLHIERVKSRVNKGGHDIPEEKIRERYTSSIDNLRLLIIAGLNSFYLYDNSEASVEPSPKQIMAVKNFEIVFQLEDKEINDWAKPIVKLVDAVHSTYPV